MSNVSVQLDIPMDEDKSDYFSTSVSTVTVPISRDVTMPVLVHAYAFSSPGQTLGLEQSRPTPDISDSQSLLDMMRTVICDVRAGAAQRSAGMAGMHGMVSYMELENKTCSMLMGVEQKMVELESHDERNTGSNASATGGTACPVGPTATDDTVPDGK